MIDLRTVKLGRKSVTHDPKKRMLATSFLETLPPPPDSVDNTNGITEWGMDGNDTLGDCTMAGLDHHHQVVTLNAGNRISATTSEVVDAYSEYCGYVVGNPSTDQGGNENDILTQVMAGSGVFGGKLLGTVSPDPKNIDHVKKAIALFRAVYMGCEIPRNIQNQNVWTAVENDGGIEGGHCMINASYTPTFVPFITWGMNQPATWSWWLKYVDECHVLVWDSTLKLFPASQQNTILAMLNQVG